MTSQIAVATLLLLAAPLIAQQPAGKIAEKPEQVAFIDIKFVGVKQVPLAALRRVAAPYEGKPYDATEIAVLGERVRNVYQEHGFFKVLVQDPEITEMPTTEGQRRMMFTFTIEEGRRYRLKTIRFEKATAFPISTLRAAFPIRRGEIFNVDKIRKGLENLRRLYGTKGYIDSVGIPDTVIDDDAGTVSLTIDMDEGKPFRIGGVKIFGLDWDRTARLLCGWPQKPGTIFRIDAIEAFFRRNKAWLSQEAFGRMELVRDEKAATVDVLLNFSSGNAPGVEVEARPEVVYVPEKPPMR